MTKQEAYTFVKDEINQMVARGVDGIVVYQDRRYLDADAVSVSGRWYSVITSPMMEASIRVARAQNKSPLRQREEKCKWLDDNGRAIY
jgi:hypothetical protein